MTVFWRLLWRTSPAWAAGLMVAACAELEQHHFNAVEFDIYAEMWSAADELQARCGNKEVEGIVRMIAVSRARKLKLYGFTGYEESAKFAARLEQAWLNFQPGWSVAYCKASAVELRATAESVLGELGKRAK